jgi:hypothetical protein
LTPQNPIIAILSDGKTCSRADLINDAQRRFALKDRAVDEFLKQAKPYLTEAHDGHNKLFTLTVEHPPMRNGEAAVQSALDGLAEVKFMEAA